jgi:serine/threonine-protein kinase HipA
MASLNVWMNGECVGEWTTSRSSTPIFRYTKAWTESPSGRALSLSLPITADRELRGPAVDYYFDNLLPDNPNIRARIRDRFSLRSTEAFDLLEAIGRDCVGAVQLLPPGREPIRWNQVEGQPLSTGDMERALRAVSSPPPLGHEVDGADDNFRISIAGAQEKTAFLSMGGAWYRTRNSTPTTHILKLPLGIIGNFRGNFSHSVENEWLCAQFVRAFGLPVADTHMARFGEQKALVVKRFDRRWIGADEATVSADGFVPAHGVWIARLPQEDFCQATGRPPTQRYESDGGPSVDAILDILARSQNPEIDRANFVLAQLAFWLLAAIDGHGKNFSIQQQPGDAFVLAPLYDVLSAWPVIGPGANQLPLQDAKLAMAISGQNRHYKIVEIQALHWQSLAERVGGGALWNRMLELVKSTDTIMHRIRADLPEGFPATVIARIASGTRSQAAKFLRTAAPG